MLLDPMMDLCLWKLTVSRKAKGSTKARTQVVALLEAVSEQVTGYMVGDAAVVAPTKAKARGRQRGNQKERRKSERWIRKEAAEVKWLMGSAPIAWSLDIGVVIAPICLSTTWPGRIQEDKNLFLQAILLMLRNPQQQCGESFSLVVHLPILHPQPLLPLHVCLRCAWFYFMIQIAIGQK